MARRGFDVVAFDLDGTLVDTAPDLAAALNHSLIGLGRARVPLELVRHLAGEGTRALLRRGLELTGGATTALIEQGEPLFFDYYGARICDLSTRADHVEGALDELAAAGIRAGICTNKPERLARKLVERLGWQARFTSIVGGDTTEASKPDPAPLRRCIEACGGGRAVFVGDSRIDLATATAAGIPFVAAATGFGSDTFACDEADAVIGSFAELLPTLGRLA